MKSISVEYGNRTEFIKISAQAILDAGYIKPTKDKRLENIIEKYYSSFHADWRNLDLVNAITSAGYIKKSDIELDKKKLANLISEWWGKQVIHSRSEIFKDVYLDLSNYITEHKKEIIK